MTAERCTNCGATCAPWGFMAAGPRLPALARDEIGRPWCQMCAADADRFAIGMGRPVAAYLSADGRQITTWAGERLARVTRSRSSRAGWHRSTIVTWRAMTRGGIVLFGRGSGEGCYTTARRAVAR